MVRPCTRRRQGRSAARPAGLQFCRYLTHPRERYVDLHQTSGTPGSALRVRDTEEDWDWWRACAHHVFARCGRRLYRHRGAGVLVRAVHTVLGLVRGADGLGANPIALGGTARMTTHDTIAWAGLPEEASGREFGCGPRSGRGGAPRLSAGGAGVGRRGPRARAIRCSHRAGRGPRARRGSGRDRERRRARGSA